MIRSTVRVSQVRSVFFGARRIFSSLFSILPLLPLFTGGGLAIFSIASSAESNPGESNPSETSVVPILEELRVTASRLPRVPRSLDAQRLDTSDIAFTSQNDIGPALQGQQGITFTNTGGPGKVSALRIRGEEASRTLVLFDGIELSDVSAPQVTTNIQHLVLGPGIGSVDVLPGPQGFFLGGDAGGVLNIRTSDPIDGYELSVRGEGGSDNHTKLSALASIGNETGGALVSAQKWRTAGFNAREDDTELADRDGYDNVTLHGRGHWRPTENSVVELVVLDIDATTEFDNCGFPRSDDCIEDYEQTSVRLGGVYEGARLSHRVSVSVSEIDRDNFAAGNFSFGADGNLNKYEYSVIGSSGIWDFAGGAELRQEDNNIRDRDQVGAYGEVGVVLENGISAGFGLRFDDNEDFGNFVTGRAHASWQTELSSSQILRVRTSYGTGFRAPSLSEEAFNAGPFAAPPATTTNLQEEKSRGLDVGVSIDGPGYSAAITYFNQRVEDEIFFDLSTFAGFLQSDGTSRSSGVSASGNIVLAEDWSLSADYLFNRARLEDGQRRLRRPRNSGRVSLVYAREGLSLGATARYVGDVDDELFGLGRSELDDYTVVDLVGSWQARPEVEVFGRVTNLFSAEAQDVIGFRSAGTGVFAGVKVSFSGK